MREMNLREVFFENVKRTGIGAAILCLFAGLFAGIVIMFATFPWLFFVAAGGIVSVMIGTDVRKWAQRYN